MTHHPLVISALYLRRAIGAIGLLLPAALLLVALLVDGQALQPSISAYYYSGARDVFIVAMGAIGVYLLAYKGYDRRDAQCSRLAGVCALCVALLPTEPATAATAAQEFAGLLHSAFAGGFFLALAYMCLVLFRLSAGAETPRKRRRNQVYTASGYAILACVAALVLLGLVDERLPLVFWVESLAVMAFGSAWLVKGEAVLADLDSTPPSA